MIHIVVECQNSSLDFFDSQKVHREAVGAVHYDQVIDECKKRQSENTGCWSDEMKKDFVNAPRWSIQKMDIISGRRWRTEEKVSILLEPELSSQIPIPSSNPRTFRKYNQSCIARQCIVTEGYTQKIYHVGNGKELRSTVNHGLIPGGVSLRTGRQAVFFTVVNPMDNQEDLGETPCDLSQKQESRHPEILGNTFRKQYFGAI